MSEVKKEGNIKLERKLYFLDGMANLLLNQIKDIKGQEIYEGDILAHKDYRWIKIEYDNGAFIARDIQSTKCNNRIIKGYIGNFNISKWKVIGNIYEDKELISQE